MKKGKQLKLGEVPLRPLEALVEYHVNGVAWKCNHFDELAAEIGLTAVDQLPLFHDQASANERPWQLVRRLFGVQPVLPKAHYNLEDLKAWSREELCGALGLTRAQLQEELAMVRGAWSGICPPPAVPTPIAAAAAPPEEFHFAEEALLKRHGFNLKGVPQEMAEWFAGRVREFDKLLTEKVTSGLAHNALMTELQLRQLDEFCADPIRNKIGSSDWRANVNIRQTLDRTYRQQIEQILEKAPWASGITGKYAFAGVLSDITKAMQDYQARGDTRLIDGLFTAMEIRVECRRSVQTPAPRYRAGLVVYVAAAKAGLWNREWQNPFKNAELKRLDAAWRETMIAAQQEAGEPLPDLEAEGPEGEYAELRAEEPKASET